MVELSKFENLHKLLDYRTTNLGLDKYEDNNIFSYINSGTKENNFTDAGVVINNNISDITKITVDYPNDDVEDIYMKTLIYNTKIIIDISNSTDTNANNIAINAGNYILDNTNNKFCIGDFSENLINNTKFYINDFMNVPTFDNTNKNIIDIDLSYYASQHIIKALFYIDILIELYNIVDRNKETKEGIINSLKELTIKSRYYTDGTTWKLYDKPYTTSQSGSMTSYSFYDIVLNSLIPEIQRDNGGIPLPPENQKTIDKISVKSINEYIDTDLKNNLTVDNANKMISCFNKSLLKHINFIKSADMVYANNFRDYYKLCRLLLNNIILANINYIVNTNTTNVNHTLNDDISSLDNNTIYTDGTNTCHYSIFYNPIYNILNSTIGLDNTYNSSLVSCLCNNATSSSKEFEYLYDIISYNDPENKLFDIGSKVSITQNNQVKIDKTPITDVAVNTKFRIIAASKYSGKNNIDTYSKPSGMIFEYISNQSSVSSLKINIDQTTQKIKSISNLEQGKIYIIKLFNVSILSNNITTDDFILYEDTNRPSMKWTGSTKTLYIVCKNKTYETVDMDDRDMYLVSVENNGEITLPSNTFSYPQTQPSIYLPGINTVTLTDGSNPVSTTNYIYSNNMLIIKIPPTNSYVLSVVPTIDNFVYKINDLKTVDAGIGTLEPRLLTVKSINNSDLFNLINNYNIHNPTDKFINKFTVNITTDGTTSPSIVPISFEKVMTDLQYFTNTVFTDNVLDNFKQYSSVDFTSDTKTNDEILNTMNNLSTINQNISKQSTVIKKNYDEYKSEHSKVLSSNTVEIVSTIILVLTLFTAIYLPLSNIDKNNSIMISGIVFIVVILTYIIITIVINMKYKQVIDAYQNYSSFKTKVDSITFNLVNNLYNQRTRISQDVILPSLKKEYDFFDKKNNNFKIFTGRTHSDLQIERRTKQKNIARISFMLQIAIIISLSILLYSVRPQWINGILSFAFILSFISLFLLFVSLTNVVHTNSNNKYWSRPDPALERLKFDNTPLS